MWTRGIAGAFLCLLGALWIAQGVGAAKGSFMTGHAQWAYIGAVVALVGVGLLISASRIRSRQEDSED